MFNFRSVFSFGASFAPSKKQKIIVGKLRSFSKDEDGIATVWAMFWLIICFALSGLAIDVTNAWKVHAILQSTADSSALAGAYELQNPNEGNDYIAEKVNLMANTYATLNMHKSRYGDVLVDTDIQLGYWDRETRTFTLIGYWVENTPIAEEAYTDGPANAVRAVTRQNSTQNTGVGTFFLRFVGFNEFTVATDAIANIFTGRCDYDGIIALGTVHLSNWEEFKDQYCVHGELGVDMPQHNTFELGTVVSMYDLETCGPSTDSCTNDSNEGVERALAQATVTGGKVTKIDGYISTLLSYDGIDEEETVVTEYIEKLLLAGRVGLPDDVEVAARTEITVSNQEPFDVSKLVKGSINEITCPREGYNVNLGLNGVGTEEALAMQNIIIVGVRCDFSFDSSVHFYDAIIATDSTSNKSFNANSEVTLGLKQDVCARGGEVSLITQGSADFAGKLSAYDMELIAAEDVHLAAHANQVGEHIGTNISAGGDVFITTGHTFVGCNGSSTSIFDPARTWALVD